MWVRRDDLPGLISVVKVKAHLTYEEVLSGRTPWQHWIGNALADVRAKVGAAAVARRSPTRAIHAQWLRAKACDTWAIHFEGAWLDDTAASGPVQALDPAGTKA